MLVSRRRGGGEQRCRTTSLEPHLFFAHTQKSAGARGYHSTIYYIRTHPKVDKKYYHPHSGNIVYWTAGCMRHTPNTMAGWTAAAIIVVVATTTVSANPGVGPPATLGPNTTTATIETFDSGSGSGLGSVTRSANAQSKYIALLVTDNERVASYAYTTNFEDWSDSTTQITPNGHCVTMISGGGATIFTGQRPVLTTCSADYPNFETYFDSNGELVTSSTDCYLSSVGCTVTIPSDGQMGQFILPYTTASLAFERIAFTTRPDGTDVFLLAQHGDNENWLFKSTDQGKRWTGTRGGDVSVFETGGTTDCLMQGNAGVFVVYNSNDNAAGEILKSIDGGTTWTVHNYRTATLGTALPGAKLVAGAPGVWMLWVYHVGEDDAFIYSTTDNWETTAVTTQLTDVTRPQLIWHTLSYNSHSDTFVIVCKEAAPSTTLRMMRSTDNGATWDTHEVSTHPFRQLVFDSATTWYGMAEYASSVDQKAWKTTDSGLTWTELPTPLTSIYAGLHIVQITQNPHFSISPPAPDNSSSKSKLSTGAWVGIGAGIIFAVVLIYMLLVKYTSFPGLGMRLTGSGGGSDTALAHLM